MAASLGAKRPRGLLFGEQRLPAAVRQRLLHEAQRHGKAVLTAPVFDTIKQARGDEVEATLDRSLLSWPVTWACRPELEPSADPPPAEWFETAVVIRMAGSSAADG